MAQLAQAYLHLKPYSATSKQLKALGRFADGLATNAAKRIYDGGVIVEVELEEGSLIVRVTVIGLLTGHLALQTYSTIADYKGFKESIVELCNDAREFAVDVCKPFQKKAGANEEQVYRFERRLKTPGKLNRLTQRLARLENSATELSVKSMQKELSEARRELEKLVQDLSPDEISTVERGLTTKKLPSPANWPVSRADLPKVVLRPEQQLALDGNFESPQTDVNSNERKPRLLYRNRIRVEEQLPRLEDRRATDTLDFQETR